MIRCLIVDDSPTFRSILRELLAGTREVEVVGEAADGEQAVQQVLALRPDVVTMDVRMPRRDGLAAIAEIMRLLPTPILVVSAAASEAREGGLGFEALRLGALEVLEKPRAADAALFERQANAIRQAVRALAGVRLLSDAGRGLASRAGTGAVTPAPLAAPVAPRCVGVVASTGGPQALAKLLSALPSDFPLPILVVQHIAEGFVGGLVAWLGGHSRLPVKLAEHGEPLAGGKVLLAPDRFHLMVDGGRVRLDSGPEVQGLRPSGTVLLSSLAKELGPAAIGVVLTGMGSDGAAGLRQMRERGAVTWAQGPASSVIYGMPRVALECGAVERVLELDAIAPALVRIASGDTRKTAGRAARRLRKRVLLLDDSESALKAYERVLAVRYDVVTARDARVGIQTARRQAVDAIVLGPAMARKEAAAMLRKLRADPATRGTAVLVIARPAREGDAPEAIWSRSQAVQQVDASALLEAVEKL